MVRASLSAPCLAACFAVMTASPQAQTPQSLATVPVEGVSVSGAVDVSNGKAALGSNGAVTAGDHAARISLTRGGELDLCATTRIHLSADRSVSDPASTALMIALDRGALEAHYATGQYSDVLLTPDLRILVSGPGQADLSVRINAQGDTCIDNHGANAPYVTVTNNFEGGLYRIQAGQRVSFQHGSLREVVDHEPEPCGCPPAAPPTSVAQAGAATGGTVAHPGQPVGGPSSTPADTAFPLAQSEGLAPTPPPRPAVPAGETHAQVTVPLIYHGDAPPPAAPASPPAASSQPQTPAAPAPVAVPPPPQPPPTDVFHKIGRLFAHLFGR